VRARLNYVELGAGDLPAVKRFYAEAFGLGFTDYGPSYAAAEDGEVALGLQGDADAASPAPLAIFEVEDVDDALTRVEAAGGAVTVPVFAFPGGRRFHFRDPAGNELAAWQPAEIHPGATPTV